MTFVTSRETAKERFHVLNQEIFQGRLREPDAIEIDNDPLAWASYIPFDQGHDEEILYLTDEFPDEDFFNHVLAHEMIHIWQWQVLNDHCCGHGSNFMQWVDILTENGYNREKII